MQICGAVPLDSIASTRKRKKAGDAVQAEMATVPIRIAFGKRFT